MRAVRIALVAGLLVTGYGVALLVRAIGAYLDTPLAVSSTSGVSVFYISDGTLAGYFPFVPGIEPVVIGSGLVVVVGALLVGALQSSASRASTAASNADAQIW